MEKNLTAVEWLVNEMIERNFFANDTQLSYTTLEHLTNQAKEMEKQQIIKAHETATLEAGFEAAAEDWAKEYWERTFNAK